MELIFEAIFQFIGEILLQLFFEILLELGLHSVGEVKKREPNMLLAALGYGLLGAIAGGISLLIMPNTFIPAGALRIVNLFVTPGIIGFVMMQIGRWRSRNDQAVIGLDRFAYAFIFAFTMALVRSVAIK